MVTQQVDNVNSKIQIAAYALLGIDFAVQLTGVVLAVVGVSTKQTRLRYEKPPPLGTSTVSIQPTSGGTVLHF
jgi:hypothetical protein